MNKNVIDKKRQSIYRSYLLAMFLILSLPLLVVIFRTGEQELIFSDSYKCVNNLGYLSEDEIGLEKKNISYRTISDIMDEKTGVLNLYYQIPDSTDLARSFVYRSKDTYTKVYLDDELLYETKVYESKLYNRSPGNIWNVVNLKPEYAGKVLRLEISMVYDTKSVVVDNMYIGDKADIIFNYIRTKIWAIIVSFMIIFIGLAILVMNIYEHFSKKIFSNSNLFLAIYAIFVGLWSIYETNVLQLFTRDMRSVQLMDNMAMHIDTLPMLFFIDYYYDVLKSRIIRIFCYLDITLLLYCFIVQVTDISDFHQTIFMAWITYFLFGVIMFFISVKSLYNKYRNNKLNVTNRLHMLGFTLLTFAGLFEAIKYAGSDGDDRAEMLRFGILLFVICFAIGNQIQNYKLVAKGVKYELVHNLAYKDGLTNIGNRTSYLEKLDEYRESNVSKLGIVFLDINNLKYVNDTFGHDDGDQLIIDASKTIVKSFGKYGDSYRIGGDEFCVLISGIDISSIIEEADKLFEIEESAINENREKNNKLVVARGFAIYDANKMKDIDDAVNAADEEMYKNKMILKGKRLSIN